MPPACKQDILVPDASHAARYLIPQVRLVNVTLTLQNFAIYRYRRVNQNLAPGCDVLAPCAAGDWGRVVLDNAFLVQSRLAAIVEKQKGKGFTQCMRTRKQSRPVSDSRACMRGR